MSVLPRILHVPDDVDYELADHALAWLEQVVGFDLDDWQKLVVRSSLGERSPGRWAASEVGLVVPRQNGKGAILEARELVGLFLIGEPLLIHTAHQFKTAQEHFIRISGRIEDVPELKKRVRAIRTGAGEQGVVLKSGARLRFLARKGGSGRGFSAPFVAFDEAMELPEATIGDMVPSQSAMPNRQRWFTGSAVDQYVHENGVVLARVRERGIRGEDQRLAFFEWSIDIDSPDMMTVEMMLDPDVIAATNPGFPGRINIDAVQDEINTLANRTAAVERYGAGDWPPTTVGTDSVISIEEWNLLIDRRSELTDQVCLAIDRSPDGAWTSIAAAGLNADGVPHIEIIQHRRGSNWVVDEVERLTQMHDVLSVVCGGKSSAASLEPECRDREIELKMLSAADETRAFGMFLNLVEAARLAHLGSSEIQSAIRGATKRPLGDAYAWDRRDASIDITPLVAATLGLWESADHGWDIAGEIHIF